MRSVDRFINTAVIASEAKRSSAVGRLLDRFVAPLLAMTCEQISRKSYQACSRKRAALGDDFRQQGGAVAPAPISSRLRAGARFDSTMVKGRRSFGRRATIVSSTPIAPFERAASAWIE